MEQIDVMYIDTVKYDLFSIMYQLLQKKQRIKSEIV